MKRGSEGREKSKKQNEKAESRKSKGEESETETNVDIKMEVDIPDSASTKGENGEQTSVADQQSEDKTEEVQEEAEEETKAGTNGTVYFSMPALTKRNVTLQMLLAAGILKPGDGTMSLEYHGQRFIGDLLETGQIKSQETSQVFSSPSAWAIACKQIINPEKIQRKSGCGWASIKYRSLKLDYYKTVWFKRVREGSIDIKNISNGATSSSDDSDDDGAPHCVLRFGEHFDSCPTYQSAIISGAKVLITCSEFKDMERLQPFAVKITVEALAMADFHCNVTNTETLGYISGVWNGDQNVLKLEVIHPCRMLMPLSTTTDSDNERNRIAIEIQKLGHEVVGWYHSHPKAPAQPSKDDVNRQLDYQIMMKGASESSYIPCVGLIISPLCYGNQGMKKSKVQLFWVMPPPENRPMEMGRPMNLAYDIISSTNFDSKKLLTQLESILNFYKENKSLVDINDISSGRFDKLKETVSSWIPELKANNDFWDEVKDLFTCPVKPPTEVDPTVKKEESEPEKLADPVSDIKEENSDDVKASSSGPTSPAHSTTEPVPSTSGLPISGPSSSSSTSRSVSTPSSTGDDPVAT